MTIAERLEIIQVRQILAAAYSARGKVAEVQAVRLTLRYLVTGSEV